MTGKPHRIAIAMLRLRPQRTDELGADPDTAIYLELPWRCLGSSSFYYAPPQDRAAGYAAFRRTFVLNIQASPRRGHCVRASLRGPRRLQSSWATWYVTRLTSALGPPSGSITDDYLASAANDLQNYAHQQVAYHRAKLRQLGMLENRLRALSVGSLSGAILVALLLAVAFEYYGGLVGWKPAAIVLLTILPATMTALNGLRAEMDLVRLIERSAETGVLLSRINRSISEGSLSFDRLSVGTHRLTSIMDEELREWRFVLESRRARTGLRQPSWLRRLKRAFGVKSS